MKCIFIIKNCNYCIIICLLLFGNLNITFSLRKNTENKNESELDKENRRFQSAKDQHIIFDNYLTDLEYHDDIRKTRENVDIKSKIPDKKFCKLNKIKENDENKTKLNETKATNLNLNYSRNMNFVLFKTNSTINSDVNYSKSNNSFTSDDLLNIIADQTEHIKNEICSSCLEINSSLNYMIDEIKTIKRVLKMIETGKIPNRKEIFIKISHCINNLNLIKADMFKLNEILDTLQKANCKNFIENLKKYSLVLNSTNKILGMIQNVLKKIDINFNLVVLN